MMRRSAAGTSMAVLVVLLAACNQKKAEEVAQVPDPDQPTLEDLAPIESSASSMMPVGEPAPPPAAQAEPQPAPPAGSPTVHVMQPKETLYSLAVRYYKDGKQWRRILEANKARISDPSKIPVGTKLIIP